MKKSTLILSLGVAILGFSAFTNVSEKTSKSPVAKSIIHWTATKVVGGGHNGTIQILQNNLQFSSGLLMGGSVIADMTTIANSDLEGEWNQKLVGHLNSEDFFSTAKYPTATLKTTEIHKSSEANTYNIVADLTIKGITNSESFVAKVVEKEDMYITTVKLNIDRTKYNVRYGSPSFFDDLGDKAISDEFTLNTTIVTQK